MSLEATLNTTNELLTKLIAIITTGIEAEATFGKAVVEFGEAAPAESKPKRTRKAAAEAPADGVQKVEATAPAAAPTVAEPAAEITRSAEAPLGLVNGDPVGTRYFHIAAHKAVYRQLPGDPDCSVPGAEIVTAAFYAEKKAEYAALTKAIIEAQKVGNAPPVAAAPAPSSTASPTSSPAPTASQVAVPFQVVVERLQTLMRSPEPGHGREAVIGILKQFLPNEAAPTVPKLEALGKNAEIVAAADALLKPAAPAEDFGLGI